MKRGVPPTALNARTGEFTPPGVTAWARSKSALDWGVGRAVTASLSRSTQGSDDSAPDDVVPVTRGPVAP